MTTTLKQPDSAQRHAILLLEAAALLHDFGKFTDGFLQNAASDGPNWNNRTYNYHARVDITQLVPATKADMLAGRLLEIYEDLNRDDIGTPVSDFNQSHTQNITTALQAHRLTAWDQEGYDLAEVLALASQWAYYGAGKQYKNWQPIFEKSMQPSQLIGRLHGAAHYEKQGVKTSNNNQQYPSTHRSTPFGHETWLTDPDATQSLTDLLRQLPIQRLDEILTDERQALLADLRVLLEQSMADTRRAINEVSLWEWGYVVATLTKPAAYTLFQRGWPDDNDLSSNLTYRTLRINLDMLGLYSRSDKISDLLGVQAVLNASDGRVQTLLEETYAIANRFYHDETGAYYLLPDIDDVHALRRQIQSFFPVDLTPQVHLEAPIKLSELDDNNHELRRRTVKQLLAIPRSKSKVLKEAPVAADNNLLLTEEIKQALWLDGRPPNAEICTVCRIRPVGYPLPHTDAEIELLTGYGHSRSDTWATYEKARDRNICRECLIRRARRSETWLQQELNGRTIWTDEVADDNGRLALFVGSFVLDEWLNGSLIDTLRADKDKADAKNASPARLYRIAETARLFWQKVTDETASSVVSRHPFRLAVKPLQELPDLGHAHTYELNVGGLALSVVWDQRYRRFLTAENLNYFASRWKEPLELFSYLQNSNRTHVVAEPSAFLAPRRQRAAINVAQVQQLDEGYEPIIPLLAEPEVCMLLVPAEQALSLAHEVKRKYEREMGRVADRLPLNLGLVFFQRRTPITAVLDAGRRMLRIPNKWVAWQIKERDNYSVTFLAENKREFTHRYPQYMGDGQHTPSEWQAPEDEWYPYLYTESPTAENEQAATMLSHVTELNAGDTVYIRNSHFDFEFLDTTGRRFEICYTGINGQRPFRPTRPFLLQDLDRFELIWQHLRYLQISQRHQMIFTIETTRDAWFDQDVDNAVLKDEVFKQFVSDTLGGAAWPSSHRWRDILAEEQAVLIEAGVHGELADLAELHMEIMKQK